MLEWQAAILAEAEWDDPLNTPADLRLNTSRSTAKPFRGLPPVEWPAMNVVEAIVATIAVVAIGWLLLVVFLWLHRPSRELARTALRLIPDLVRLVRGLLADGQTSLSVRMALAGLLLYLLSPIDLIPDFVPVIGSADDLIVSAVVLRWAGRRVGLDDLRARWTGNPAGFEILRRLLGI
jgi:uncharacterized membrane protein YkvA (DUF1232 family)